MGVCVAKQWPLGRLDVTGLVPGLEACLLVIGERFPLVRLELASALGVEGLGEARRVASAMLCSKARSEPTELGYG